ncbi:MAG: tetratricopeptide repeat protein [Reyranella sp.]|uniref:adenylate/guanylate cyclase domain-containing protein n=1 Tax=Reyranella sp. TaxID=1929291 RepID=UPI001AC28E34|nr:adenylate/guanylate cyclase domain-containing protein [Reyranella sp.]MBN9086774.1 tetratricopeptide repeat protein [Reyranella sp.]
MTGIGSGGNRRLATILFADVAGYSRLMRADEERTLTDLRAHLAELVAPAVERFHGRIVKSLGDGVLAEFGSAVEAVRCAVELQSGMAERNAGLPADRRQSFRIGLHLGDVITNDYDVFGDTVNVASRLQTLAAPGAIVLSASVHEQVRDKLTLTFRDLGARTLKNIDRPMRAYALAGSASVGAGRRRWVMAALAGAVFALVAAGGLFFYLHRGDAVGSKTAASTAPMSASSVAVLLFTNQSGDVSQDYFADGLTEDITRALGRFRQLTVVAYRAVLPWRGKELPPMEMGRALGARFLVSGSVRRIDDRVRVTVQLADANNGTQLWAEQYDERLTDIFEVQDRVARRVAGSLASNLQQIALQQSLRKPTGNLDAYDLLLRARALSNEATRAGNRMAREALEKVTRMSPNYADAQAELAEATFQRAVYGWSEFADQDVDSAVRLAQKAIELDEENVLAHSVLARAYTVQQRYDLALAESERALQLNPSDTEALTARAAVLLWTGDIDGSIAAGELAMRLNGNVGPEPALNLGIAYLLDKRFADAVKLLEAARVRYPAYPILDFPLAGAYAELGRDAEAAEALDQGKRKDPYLDLAGFGTRFKDPALKRRLDATLRKAGFK